MVKESVTTQPGNVRGGHRGGSTRQRCIIAPVQAPQKPQDVTAALKRLQRPWSSTSPADYWRMRDEGRADVNAWRLEDGSLIGVAVVAMTECPAGKAFDLLACKFAAGHYARGIEEWVMNLARANGCSVVRLFSRRPLPRLVEGLKVESVTYTKPVPGVEQTDATIDADKQDRIDGERLINHVR